MPDLWHHVWRSPCFFLLATIFKSQYTWKALHTLLVCLQVVSLIGSDIVESNPGKFRLGESELKERKDFVERTRTSVQVKHHSDFFVCLFF